MRPPLRCPDLMPLQRCQLLTLTTALWFDKDCLGSFRCNIHESDMVIILWRDSGAAAMSDEDSSVAAMLAEDSGVVAMLWTAQPGNPLTMAELGAKKKEKRNKMSIWWIPVEILVTSTILSFAHQSFKWTSFPLCYGLHHRKASIPVGSVVAHRCPN